MHTAWARWIRVAGLGLLGLAFALSAWAQGLRPVPELTARVIDQTGTLQAAQVQALEAKLAAFEQASGPQIVVLVVSATAPEDIAAYAYRVADAWKIGRRDVGDGLLVLVAKDERRIRIEVARALEGAIPDLAARQIIDRAMRPAFREGDYAGGLDAGLEALMARLRGENLPLPQAVGPGTEGLQWPELAMFFFFAVPVLGSVLSGMLGRKLGALLSGGVAGGVAWWFSASLLLACLAGIAAMIVVAFMGLGAALRSAGGPRVGSRHGGWGGPGGGWGGGGWGGGGGGGFSSGGGGSFGGGGASGGW